MGEEKRKIVAIIPAKGNSTLPSKNIKILNGKPLIAWTIEASLASKLIDKTIVSTDDELIAGIARLYEAEVIMRPEELCQPLSPTDFVLLHAVEELEKQNYFPEIVVLLQCTSPIRRKDDIDNAIKKLIDTNADSLFSSCIYRDTFWMLDEVLKPITYNVEDYQSRFHQNVKPLIRETGPINITRVEVLKKLRNRLGGKIETFELPWRYSLELHDEFDFWLAGKILERLENEKDK